MNDIKQELDRKGYVVLEHILTQDEVAEAKEEFYKWQDKIPYHDYFHQYYESKGIYKYHEVGHQRFAWLIKTNPRIQNIFKYLWGCQDLIVSFDGACYIPQDCQDEDSHWTHTDQAPNRKGLHCYQGLVALTENRERTLVVYEGSHKLHQEYFETKQIDSDSNWFVFDEEYIDKLKELKRVLHVPAGALVIWDSRTYHQNQFGRPFSEERMVQYVCYLPSYHLENTEEVQDYRKECFRKRRTTTHWPAPVIPVPRQPYTYYNTEVIDYSKLEKPYLEDLKEKINKLL